jgi:carbamoyltransferase
MRILGISAFYHDSAAALIENGVILAAVQEERFTRKKNDADFPFHAVKWCLEHAGIRLADVDAIAFYEKPFRKFDRLLHTYLHFAPQGFNSFALATDRWLNGKLNHRKLIANGLAKQLDGVDLKSKLVFTEHHESHAASAFYPSPFQKSTVLTLDGVGEWATTSLSIGDGNRLDLLKEIRFPHSLGLLYAAFTAFLGFKVNSGEYKMMGLAPYGAPRFAGVIRDNMVDLKPDGSFRLNMEYFDYCTGLQMTGQRFSDLFDIPKRFPDDPIETQHMDVAASIQVVTEEIILKLAQGARSETGNGNLCLAGGVALNCVANGKILRSGIFDDIWVQPASGDAGGALGAALSVYYRHFGAERQTKGQGDTMRGAYLGPEFSNEHIQKQLDELGANYQVLNDTQIFQHTAKALASGMAIGWFQGKAEYGPRALGNRSIIADPRAVDMQKTLNKKVKNRESFRPFAPSVMEEDAADWFAINRQSPYMLFVANILETKRLQVTADDQERSGFEKLKVLRTIIPAVTHVDYSARLHTVSKSQNLRFHSLLSAFKNETGCPVLVNTSFNVRGEPIVNTPKEAFQCFMGTGLDVLVVGNCVLAKSDQTAEPERGHTTKFELD